MNTSAKKTQQHLDNMKRRFLKERDAFPNSVDEYNQHVERRLRHRRAELDAAWQGLEEGWKKNNERMVTLEVRPRTDEESVVNLNVGGSNVALSWHLLAETEGFKHSVLGALLEGVWGKGLIPRDADGRIVLDESPACIKHIIHKMLASSGAEGVPESAAGSAVAVDEVPCLMYTVNELGLPGFMPAHPKYPIIHGSSTILEAFEIAPLSYAFRQWFGGSAEPMTLIYRATRDGFGSKAFTDRCNESSRKTISLIRVSSGQEDDVDSVVGGYAIYSWGRGVGSREGTAQETFIFKLKDGTVKEVCQPTKWHPNGYSGKEFRVPRSDGPYFCEGDLAVIFDEESGSCTMQTKQTQTPFPTNLRSLFLALNDKKVVDIEVYRYSAPDPPTTTTSSTTKPGGDALADAEVHDIRSFGQSIANSLMEERVVLNRAVKEMEAAGARVSAAVGALKTVYGPSVAAGEQDTVVELNVRRTRVTTLLSTLQACPRSALAAMFNEDRWPATDKDKDQHGGRLIDCNPICFSKILDVLRMRKRASWIHGATGGGEEEESRGVLPGGVLIKQADAEAFDAAINMYFPGCESFIADLVQHV
ncbi:unnamed protein product [Laminaria digitata]